MDGDRYDDDAEGDHGVSLFAPNLLRKPSKSTHVGSSVFSTHDQLAVVKIGDA